MIVGIDAGIGIDIQGAPEGIVIAGNTIRDSRQPKKRIGIRIGVSVGTVHLANNPIEGYATPVMDSRKR